MQFFLPGIPQVYYVGLLAGENDMALLQRNGVGRDINRHHYSRAEIEADLTKPVVQALLRLIRLRNAHPAFNGQFSLAQAEGDSVLGLQWSSGERSIGLRVDFASQQAQIVERDGAAESSWQLAGG